MYSQVVNSPILNIFNVRISFSPLETVPVKSVCTFNTCVSWNLTQGKFVVAWTEKTQENKKEVKWGENRDIHCLFLGSDSPFMYSIGVRT